MVFSTVNQLSIIQKIEELSTINFVKWNVQLNFRVAIQASNYIVGSQEVEAWDRAVIAPHHGESFSTTCLAINKYGPIDSIKRREDYSLDSLLVYLKIRHIFSIASIKGEGSSIFNIW